MGLGGKVNFSDSKGNWVLCVPSVVRSGDNHIILLLHSGSFCYYLSTLLAYRVYVTVRCLSSVRPSVRLSHLSAAAVAGSEFAAVGPAGRIYRLIAARPALSSNRAAVSPINAKELTQNSVVL